MISDLDIWRAVHTSTLAVCFIATGCADQSQRLDRYVDCPAIFAEIQVNNTELRELALVASGKIWQNDPGGVVGAGYGPMYLGLNSQMTLSQEVAANNSRLRYLTIFAAIRHCGPPPPP